MRAIVVLAQQNSVQIQILRLRIEWAFACQPRLLLRRNRSADLLGNRLRDLALPGQVAAQVAHVGLRPQRTVRPSVDQLRADAHPIALAQHAALHHRVHRKLAGNLRQRLLGALVAHRRGERDHTQRGNLSQIVDQLLGHAIGKILLRGDAGEIFQRQNSDRVNGTARVFRFLPAVHAQIAQQRGDCDRQHRRDR